MLWTWPLYARLFDTFEDVRVGSTKEMIEALLLCTRESVDEQGQYIYGAAGLQ